MSNSSLIKLILIFILILIVENLVTQRSQAANDKNHCAVIFKQPVASSKMKNNLLKTFQQFCSAVNHHDIHALQSQIQLPLFWHKIVNENAGNPIYRIQKLNSWKDIFAAELCNVNESSQTKILINKEKWLAQVEVGQFYREFLFTGLSPQMQLICVR